MFVNDVILYGMKKKYLHTLDYCSDMQPPSTRRPYTAPNIWTSPSFLEETVLGDTDMLHTTIKDGPATEEGRSNEMNFDEDELSVPPSLWND